ncbi:unnamed protein product [Angiostrongylus costaricensis]|uniref:Uncharacterized protein n=1 Tax=Angiostrongylus costaricensis TaxID=334426 RepID=A0A0R3PPR2_ANGCS|nr:unnamed protein product [Angiostrongylus costaricensis]
MLREGPVGPARSRIKREEETASGWNRKLLAILHIRVARLEHDTEKMTQKRMKQHNHCDQVKDLVAEINWYTCKTSSIEDDDVRETVDAGWLSPTAIRVLNRTTRKHLKATPPLTFNQPATFQRIRLASSNGIFLMKSTVPMLENKSDLMTDFKAFPNYT